MNIFIESRPEKYRVEKKTLLRKQTVYCAIRAHHFPRIANLCGCVSPENYSQ